MPQVRGFETSGKLLCEFSSCFELDPENSTLVELVGTAPLDLVNSVSFPLKKRSAEKTSGEVSRGNLRRDDAIRKFVEFERNAFGIGEGAASFYERCEAASCSSS